MSYEHIRSNKHRGFAFLNAVVLYLHGCGQDTAEPVVHTARKLSELLREDPGDIDGVEGWALTVQSGREHDFSTQLALAEESAEMAGKPFSASIRSRRGHSLSQSYVVMSLETFGRILPMVDIPEPEAAGN